MICPECGNANQETLDSGYFGSSGGVAQMIIINDLPDGAERIWTCHECGLIWDDDEPDDPRIERAEMEREFASDENVIEDSPDNPNIPRA